jgi:SAM domain (Sterile alpha motif)
MAADALAAAGKLLCMYTGAVIPVDAVSAVNLVVCTLVCILVQCAINIEVVITGTAATTANVTAHHCCCCSHTTTLCNNTEPLLLHCYHCCSSQLCSHSQYREAFSDAAVDGAFLFDLGDDDLANTLGVEHRLHRKKLLGAIDRLRAAEAERDRQLVLSLVTNGNPTAANGFGSFPTETSPLQEAFGSAAAAALGPGSAAAQKGPTLAWEELAALCRHGKYRAVKEALDSVQDKKYDRGATRAAYVDGYGTVSSYSYSTTVRRTCVWLQHYAVLLLQSAAEL